MQGLLSTVSNCMQLYADEQRLLLLGDVSPPADPLGCVWLCAERLRRHLWQLIGPFMGPCSSCCLHHINDPLSRPHTCCSLHVPFHTPQLPLVVGCQHHHQGSQSGQVPLATPMHLWAAAVHQPARHLPLVPASHSPAQRAAGCRAAAAAAVSAPCCMLQAPTLINLTACDLAFMFCCSRAAISSWV